MNEATVKDLQMLMYLLAKYPQDVNAVIRNKARVSEGYGADKETVCSYEGGLWSQSALGLINQLRMNRGEPRICYSMENGRITGFGIFDEDLKKVVNYDGTIDTDGVLEPAPQKPGAGE